MQLPESIPIAPDKSGSREWTFCLNHAAMFALERLSGQPAWAILVQQSETLTRIAQLAWAGSETFRHNTRQQLTYEQFLENGYLPDYLSDEWMEFQDRINDLVGKTFPKASGTRTQLQTLQAAQILSNLANTALLTGTSESTLPSDSSNSVATNSGTDGTGSTLTS